MTFPNGSTSAKDAVPSKADPLATIMSVVPTEKGTFSANPVDSSPVPFMTVRNEGLEEGKGGSSSSVRVPPALMLGRIRSTRIGASVAQLPSSSCW